MAHLDLLRRARCLTASLNFQQDEESHELSALLRLADVNLEHIDATALARWCIDVLNTAQAPAQECLLFLESLFALVAVIGGLILELEAVVPLLQWAKHSDAAVRAASVRVLERYIACEKHCEQHEAQRTAALIKAGLLPLLMRLLDPCFEPDFESSDNISLHNQDEHPDEKAVQWTIWSLSGSATLLSLPASATFSEIWCALSASLGVEAGSLFLLQDDAVVEKNSLMSCAAMSGVMTWVRCRFSNDSDVITAALRLLDVVLSVQVNWMPEMGMANTPLHRQAVQKLGLPDRLTSLRVHESLDVRLAVQQLEGTLAAQQDDTGGIWWLLATWFPILAWMLFLHCLMR